MTDVTGPLDGIRILDLTRILLRLAVGKACGRVKGGLNFGSRAQGN